MTNPTTPGGEVALLPVIQADREFAAEILSAAGKSRPAFLILGGGLSDHPMLQRVARHRLQPQDTAASEKGRPFAEWNEDHGDVLWWRLPVLESPYAGSPLDLGRSMKVVVQIGFEEHDLPITMTGGWPFSDEDEEHLWWTPLPEPVFARTALTATSGTKEEG